MNKEKEVTENYNEFISLTPILEPQENSIYQRALRYALNEDDVFNIALTGPYGSGKSSILKRYLSFKESEESTLVVSLASFEGEKRLKPEEVEVRILQQILYSADADTLPYSRFKRIKENKVPIDYSIAIVAWLIAISTIALKWNDIFSSSIFSLLSLAYFGLVSVFLATSIFGIHKLLTFFSSLEFKKFSIRNIEFEAASKQTSVLNRYLDELLYFFEIKNYKTVVFEDVDRFDQKHIFIKLREINSLINNNEKIKHLKKIKFIYAVKDSTFEGVDKTKFFDFVIPVVPALGHYNSEYLFMERKSGVKPMKSELKSSFIKDVSDYINDPRLINNIFNELNIYIEAIDDFDLNVNELFAVIIYKNLYSKDFEDLHNSSGEFQDLLYCKSAISQEIIKDSQNKVDYLEKELDKIENEFFYDESQLLNVYLAEIYKQNTNSIYIPGDTEVLLNEVETVDQLLSYANDSNCLMRQLNGNNKKLSFSSIENSIDESNGLNDRKEFLLNKKNGRVKEIADQIRREKEEIAKINNKSLAQILNMKPQKLDSFFRVKEYPDSKSGDVLKFDQCHRLMRFLILEGYLNENYELYTSLFKEHDEWSRNDRSFITTLKSKEPADPDMAIDHANDVIKRMTYSDRVSVYALNVDLFDFILSLPHATDLKKCIVSAYQKNYKTDVRKAFTELYIDKGKEKIHFFSQVSKYWGEYLDAIFYEHEGLEEAKALLRYIDLSLFEKSKDTSTVRKKLTTDLSIFYASCGTSEEKKQILDNLRYLDVKVESLPSLSEYPDATKIIVENCLFEITEENIGFILDVESYVDFSIGFVDILSLNEEVIEYIFQNFSIFYEKVLLSDFNCWKETDSSVKEVVKRVNDSEIIEGFFKEHVELFLSPEDIPDCHLDLAYRNHFVQPCWKSVSYAFDSEDVSDSSLVKYLNNDDVCRKICSQRPLAELKKSLDIELKRFIRYENSLNEESYIRLNRLIDLVNNVIPAELDSEKVLGLANSRLIRLNSKTYQGSYDFPEVLTAVILSNKSEFLNNSDQYFPLPPQVKQGILESGESTKPLKELVLLSLEVIDLDSSDEIIDVACKSYGLLSKESYNEGVVFDLIKYCSEPSDSFALFRDVVNDFPIDTLLEIIEYKIPNWSEFLVMRALKLVPDTQINEITEYGKAPKVNKRNATINLLKTLEQYRYTGKVSEYKGMLRVHTKKNRPTD
ncbi:hypothetical protein [Idiomarina abyssalis]|uniref:YobI family P-loop NTPase n=1 Tax=Idiomarina abyssalis TaxID=86102 RepID=UPI003A8DCD3C